MTIDANKQLAIHRTVELFPSVGYLKTVSLPVVKVCGMQAFVNIYLQLILPGTCCTRQPWHLHRQHLMLLLEVSSKFSGDIWHHDVQIVPLTAYHMSIVKEAAC